MAPPKAQSTEQPEKPPRPRIKKVKGHGGHHGGAWKVAYADFVTAMMALFLVLWLVSQADQKLKEQLANYFKSPGIFNNLQGGILEGPQKVSMSNSPLTSKEEQQMLHKAAEVMKTLFSKNPKFKEYKDLIKIDVTKEGLKIQILDEAKKISFESGSAHLNPTAKAILGTIAKVLCTLPNALQVGGHTDKALFPKGSGYTNWELSADRANAARRELEAVCVKPEQIAKVVGFADTDPFVPDDPYAPQNRRISILVLRMVAIDPNADQKVIDAIEETGVLGGKVSSGENSHQKGHQSSTVTEGGKKSVNVGTPDQLPSGVKVSKAPASSHSDHSESDHSGGH
jgi:chemotaxis protein MotB